MFQALGNRIVQHPELETRMFLDVSRKPNVYCCGQQIVQKGKPGSLHAKCIVVDGAHVFVSSANFTEAAQERNIEVGLLIQSRALAERVRRFFDALLDSGYFGRAI